ncbi:hypothetical protein Tco_0062069 [Tanacetum coccineum]
MAPKRRTTRLNPETTPAATATTTTTVTNGQLQAMIDKGITAVLASRDANTNGVDNHNSGTGARRNKRATRECTYPDFMKCQPLNFKGTKGVVELTQWIKKMETVFRISNYSVENQIKFSTCTLLGNALTWWNSNKCRLHISICTDKTKITRKQSKTGKHEHENQKSTKRSQRIKAKARNVKPQSNPVKEKSIIGQQKSTRPTIFQFNPQSFTKVQK